MANNETPQLGWSIDCTSSTIATPSVPKWKPGKSSGVVERDIDGSGQAAQAVPNDWVLRRWEAATTDRLNEAHWLHAVGDPINHDLARDLPMLRARVTHEVANNPNLEGVVNTHATDVIGDVGPSLQVQSDDDAYSDRLEYFWREWAERCDIAGQDELPEILRVWIKSLWTAGDFLTQEVTEPNTDFPVSMRLHALHGDRLGTPPTLGGDSNVALGVRRNRFGKPLQYFISDPTYMGPYQLETGKYTPIPADMLHHGFLKAEPGQVRGFPIAASSLPAVADLRDYDTQVMDAARSAADSMIWFTCKDPEGPKWYAQEGEEFAHKRRTSRTAPPGWDVQQLQAGQPTAQYVEHRRERMAEFGRAISMPLMLIRLDSSQHNYSSARFDQQVYVRHLMVLQSWIARRFLRRMVRGVSRELELAGELRRPRGEIKYVWNFPRPPHVDPTKERAAIRIGLQNRTVTFADACAAEGRSEDEVIASWMRTKKKLEKAGMSEQEIVAFLQFGTPTKATSPATKLIPNANPGSRQPAAANKS